MNRTARPFLSRVLRLPARIAVGAVAMVAVAQAGGVAFPAGIDDLAGLSDLPGLAADASAVVASGAPGTAQRVATLMTKHDCWAGEAPSDVTVPGHAVVTLKKGDRLVTRYGARALTDRALGHVFGGTGAGAGAGAGAEIFMVHGFCR